MLNVVQYKTGVIDDPLFQTHSQASSEHCFLLFCIARFEKWGQTYGQTDAKTMIPTVRDCGLAEWINTIRNSFAVPLRTCIYSRKHCRYVLPHFSMQFLFLFAIIEVTMRIVMFVLLLHGRRKKHIHIHL